LRAIGDFRFAFALRRFCACDVRADGKNADVSTAPETKQPLARGTRGFFPRTCSRSASSPDGLRPPGSEQAANHRRIAGGLKSELLSLYPLSLIPLSLILTCLALVGATLAAAEDASPFHASTAAAVEQAHQQLWRGRVDPHGIIYDYIGALPTPEDCALGKPNAIGWWSPIEDGPMFTGLYLPAMCERARRSGDAADKAKARRLAQGLMKCASVSEVRGFIARGVGMDGRCHYPLGSDDQTHPWFHGLHAYCLSGIPSEGERGEIIAKMREVAEVLEISGWRCPADGAFKGEFRGAYRGRLFRDAVRYLHLLKIMHELTREEVWQARYQKALAERPHGTTEIRAQICAEGYARDREAIRRIDEYQQWIYVGSQAALAGLLRMERDAGIRAQYRAGLVANAQASLKALKAHREFDNRDAKVFGHADWRAVFTTWFPQPTQADAERLSRIADVTKKGERKAYEQRLMQNPLAAAAIAAFAVEGGDREAIERVIRHYDYSTIKMSTFFFAECAWYALPPVNE
jgi:hypothetical protein